MSNRFRKQSHTIYECKYHTIFCPKYRYRVLTDEVRKYTTETIEKLVRQKEGLEIIEPECAAGSRSSGDVDTAKVFSRQCDGIFEREGARSESCKGMRS